MIVVPPHVFDDLKLTVPECSSDTASLSSEVDENDYTPGTVTPDERNGDRFFGLFPNSPSYLDHPYPRGLRIKNTFVEFERTSELIENDSQVTRMRTWPMSPMDEFCVDVITLQSYNDKLRRPSLDSDSQPMSPSSIFVNGRRRAGTNRTESRNAQRSKLTMLDKGSASKCHQSDRRGQQYDKNVDAMEPMETYEKDEKMMELMTWDATQTQYNHQPSTLDAHLSKQEHQRKLLGKQAKERVEDTYYGASRYETGDEVVGMYLQNENGRSQDGRMSLPLHSHLQTNDADRMMMPCAHKKEPHGIKQQQQFSSSHRTAHDEEEKHKKCIGGDNNGDREGGSKAKSTIMVRNLSRKCTQKMLTMDLDMGGFKKQFDFIYLPFCFETKSNVGYAFINFHTGLIADKFISYWNTKHFSNITRAPIVSDRRVLTATYADVQGLDSNVDRLVGDYKIARIHNPRYQPSIFLDGVRVNFQKYTESLRAKKQTNAAADIDQPKNGTTSDE